VRNMSETQLRAAIELGERVVSGEAGLVELDGWSLRVRGKVGKGGMARGEDKAGEYGDTVDEVDSRDVGVAESGKMSKRSAFDHVGIASDAKMSPAKKRKVVSKEKRGEETAGTISKYFLPTLSAKSRTGVDSSSVHADIAMRVEGNKRIQSITTPTQQARADSSHPSPPPTAALPPKQTQTRTTSPKPISEAEKGLNLIATSPTLTSFRRTVLALLCSIPRGQYTTYAAMARHVNLVRQKQSQSSSSLSPPANQNSQPPTSNTCARAIGNAMRNNPFAPLVPCHRVLAADGSIGGFGGHWGEDGKFAGDKRRLLREEGVRFDGRGRAVGRPWEGWVVDVGV